MKAWNTVVSFYGVNTWESRAITRIRLAGSTEDLWEGTHACMHVRTLSQTNRLKYSLLNAALPEKGKKCRVHISLHLLKDFCLKGILLCVRLWKNLQAILQFQSSRLIKFLLQGMKGQDAQSQANPTKSSSHLSK